MEEAACAGIYILPRELSPGIVRCTVVRKDEASVKTDDGLTKHTTQRITALAIIILIFALVAVALAYGWPTLVMARYHNARLFRLQAAKLLSAVSDEKASETIQTLGGQTRAVKRLRAYLHMPSSVAPHKNDAIYLLGFCNDAAIPILAETLAHSEKEARCEAIIGLAKMGPRASCTVPALEVACARSDGNERVLAAMALLRITGEREKWGGVLISNLNNPREAASYEAEEFLISLGESAVPLLVAAMDTQDVPKRRPLVRILVKIGSKREESIRALKRASTDSDEYIRRAASDALKANGANN